MNLMKMLTLLVLFNFSLGVIVLGETNIDSGQNEIKSTNLLDLGNNSFLFSSIKGNQVNFYRYDSSNAYGSFTESFKLEPQVSTFIQEFHRLLKLSDGKILSLCKANNSIYYYIASDYNNLKANVNLNTYNQLIGMSLSSTLSDSKIEVIELPNNLLFFTYVLDILNGTVKNHHLFYEVYKIDSTTKTLKKYINRIFISDNIHYDSTYSLEKNDFFVYVSFNRKFQNQTYIKLLITRISLSDSTLFTYDDKCKNEIVFNNTENHLLDVKLVSYNDYLTLITNRCDSPLKTKCQVVLFKLHTDCYVLLNNIFINTFETNLNKELIDVFKLNYDRIAVLDKIPTSTGGNYKVNLSIIDSNANTIYSQKIFSQEFNLKILKTNIILLPDNKYIISFHNLNNLVYTNSFIVSDLDLFAVLNIKGIEEGRDYLQASVEKISDDIEYYSVLVYLLRENTSNKIFARILKKNLQTKAQSFFVADSGREPKVIVFSNNNFLVSWKSSISQPYYSIMAAKYTKEGTSIDSKTLVVNDDSGSKDLSDYLNYDIIALKDDKFIVTWHQLEKMLSGVFYYRSYFIIFGSDLIAINTSPIAIGPTNKLKDQMFPSLVRLENNDILITYQNNGFSDASVSSGFKVFAFSINLSGLVVKSEKMVSPNSPGNYFYPKAVQGNQNEIIVTYLNDGVGNETWKNRKVSVLAQKLDLNLDKLGNQVTIKSDAAQFIPKNLAKSCGDGTLMCPTSQSSDYSETTFKYISNLSINENYDQNFNNSKSCSCTNSGLNSWWSIIFTSYTNIRKVKIWNRGDVGLSRLNNFSIKIGDISGDKSKIPDVYKDVTFEHTKGKFIHEANLYSKGMSLTIYSNTAEILTLCEVEIQGTIDQPIFPILRKIDNYVAITFKPISASIMNPLVSSVFFIDPNTLLTVNSYEIPSLNSKNRTNFLLLKTSFAKMTIVPASSNSVNAGFFVADPILDEGIFQYANCAGNQFFDFSTHKCIACHSSCSRCVFQADRCLDCASGFYKKAEDNFKCESSPLAASGFYLNDYEKLIFSCKVQCSSCTSGNICTGCSSYHYVKDTNYCLNEIAGEGVFLMNGVWRLCDPSCQNCFNIYNNCRECKKNYISSNNATGGISCLETSSTTAPNGFFIDRSLLFQILTPCEISCATCNETAINCISCAANYYPLENFPLPNPCFISKDGYYFDSYFKLLKKCDVSCSTCSTLPKQCISCATGYHLKEGSTECFNAVPSGFFLDNTITPNKYRSCTSPCTSCVDSETKCLTCISNNYLKENSYECFSSLPSGYYLNTGTNPYTYKSCVSPCVNCVDSANNCLSCIPGNFLKEKTYECLSSPPPGFYLDSSISMYRSCLSPCATCEVSATKCLSCVTQFYLKENTNECFNSAPTGFYLNRNVSPQKYEACHSSCLKCIDNPTNCTECAANFYFFENTSSCRNIVSAGYFIDRITNTSRIAIIKCDSSCSTCQNRHTECIDCKVGYHKIENDTDNRCFVLSNGYFLNTQYTPNKLSLCDDSCLRCDQKEKCLLCKTNFYKSVDNGVTSDICYQSLSGFYLDSTLFKKCDSSCKECKNNPSFCSECSADFTSKDIDSSIGLFHCFLKSSINPGFFYSSELNLFVSCHAGCLDCTVKATNCTTCKLGFAKKESDSENECVPVSRIIPGFHYIPEGNIFKKCDASCEECEATLKTCKKCNENYYPKEADNTAPVKECHLRSKLISGFLVSEEKKLFRPCDRSCQTCEKNYKACKECSPGFYKKENDASNECFDMKIEIKGFYFNEKEKFFKRCDEACKECKEESKNCLLCNDAKKYFRFDYKRLNFDKNVKINEMELEQFNKFEFLCITRAPEGFYIDESKKAIEKCPEKCRICNDKQECLECNQAKSYFPIEHKKYECSNEKRIDGYYFEDSTKIFKKCKKSCKTCRSELSCLQCNEEEGYFYLKDDISEERKCFKECPKNYILDEKNKCCEKIEIPSIGENKNNNTDAQIEKLNNISEGVIEKLQTNITLNDIKALNTIVEVTNGQLSEKVTDMLVTLSNSTMSKVMSGELPPDPALLNIASMAIQAKMNNILNLMDFNSSNESSISSNSTHHISNDTAAAIQEKQNIMNEMKASVNGFIDVMIKAKKHKKKFRFLSENEDSNETDTGQTILKTDIFSVEFASNDKENEKEMKEAALKDKLSIANFTECEKILKSENKIPENVSLIYKKIEFDSKTDLSRAADPSASSGVSFEFLHPDTFVKLNSTNCSSIPTPISIPFKKSERLSMSLYLANQAINKGTDIYNKESPGFKSRCIKSKDLNTSADTSMSFRRNKMFQNETIGCSAGCTYQGLEGDGSGYVRCDCTTSGREEMSNTGSDFSFDPIPKMNYDIVLCYYETYNDPNFKTNIGLITTTIVFVIGIFSYFTFRNLTIRILQTDLKSVQYEDAVCFDSDKYSKEEFFLRAPKNIESIKDFEKKERFKKLNNNLSQTEHHYFLFNKYDDDFTQIEVKEKSLYPVVNLMNRKKIKPEKDKISKINRLTEKDKCFNPLVFNKPRQNALEGVQLFSFNRKNRNINVLKKIGVLFKTDCELTNNCFNQFKTNKCPNQILHSGYEDEHDLFQKKNHKLENVGQQTIENDFNKLINKKDTEKKRRFHLRFITVKDHDELNPYQAIKYDKRSFFRLLFDVLKTDHPLFNIFFNYSIIEPLWLRVVKFYLDLILIFALSAFFFSDDYLDARAALSEEQRNSPFYAIINEISKTCFTLVFCFIISFIIELTHTVTEDYEEDLNEKLRDGNVKKIQIQYKKFNMKMQKRYRIFFFTALFFSLICTYYCTVFCSIYNSSYPGWFQGGVIGLMLDIFAVSIAIPIIKTSVRVLIRNFKFLKFLIIIDYSFFILNFVM